MSKYILFVVALAGVVVAGHSQSIDTRRTMDEKMSSCIKRTGLKRHEIREAKTRNLGCSLDCETVTGLLHSFNYQEKEPCGDLKDHTCRLGQCTQERELAYDDLQDVVIAIKSARVPDLDDAPGQGYSDTFVAVSIVEGGEPSYKAGELISHTYVIQDSSNPKWNFSVGPAPMRLNTRLRFDAHDSDKPLLVPDFIGKSEVDLSELLNKGPQRLELFDKNNMRLRGNYYLEVEITGKPYQARA